MSERSTRLDRLIAAAKQNDRPPAEVSARAWASLEEAIGAGVGPSVAVTATSAGATGGLGIKGIVVVVVAIAMAGGAAIVVGRGEEETSTTHVERSERVAEEVRAEPPRAAETPPRTEHVAAAVEVDAEREPAADPPIASPVVERRSDRRRSATIEAAPAERETPPVEAAPGSTLAEQARLLGQAWRAVQAGDTANALALVRDHASRFPDSPLAPEREACRIVAWCEEGRPWAPAKAKAFLAAHGGTPAARVRQACTQKE